MAPKQLCSYLSNGMGILAGRKISGKPYPKKEKKNSPVNFA